MDFDTFRMHLYEYTPDEIFYRNYFEARQEGRLNAFLMNLNMKDVLERHLLVLEKKETIPPRFEDRFFFNMSDPHDIVIQKHNRYSPALLHRHNFFELTYVFEGSCVYETEDSRLELRTGDLIILSPETDHQISVFDDSIVFNGMLRQDTISEIFSNFLEDKNDISVFILSCIHHQSIGSYLLYKTGKDPMVSQNAIYMLYEYNEKKPYYHQVIASCMRLIGYRILRDYQAQMASVISGSTTEKDIIFYMQTHMETVTLTTLAEKFNYTTEYTSRLIKSLTGKSYEENIGTMRISKAMKLLGGTDYSIAEISGIVGYQSPEYFSRVFKLRTGVTPGQYRKTYLKK